MKSSSPIQQSLPENIIQHLFSVSNSCTLKTSLETLIETSKESEGRSSLASQNILPTILDLIQCLSYASSGTLLMSSLKLLRNLCAGEIENQNSFIEKNGVGIVSNILHSAMLLSNLDRMTIRIGLQVLANVSLAGEEHQQAIWTELYPKTFASLARILCCEICDPLCMIIYNLSSKCSGFVASFCGDSSLSIIEEILRTASTVGFKEGWLKLLLFRLCMEEPYFPLLFSKLCIDDTFVHGKKTEYEAVFFTSEQAFLLTILSEVLSERIRDTTITKEFVICIFEIFNSSISTIDLLPICKCSLPTGTIALDVLGYSLAILRDICAQDVRELHKDTSEDAVDVLLSLGLIDLLLGLLRDMEPPAIIKKSIQQTKNQDRISSCYLKPCHYKGFRRDIVAVIANCTYRRKHVQDDIRKKNGIFVLLQECVSDDNNPFLREWGIWAVRNLLEGNSENQKLVAELEVQGSVNVPEITNLGLQVEIDPKTRRAKLVNAS